MPDETPRIAIIGAMSAEVDALREAMLVEARGRDAGFNWWAGVLAGRRVVLAQGGMGKVAAAACCQHLIDAWNLTAVLCCGLAGGLDERLQPGDIVIADALMQHDVDASPIFPRYQLPGLDIDVLRPAAELVEAATAAASEFLASLPLSPASLAANGVVSPRAVRGMIATGDQFIDSGEREALRQGLPQALCVEMEGAAIAQVCHLNGKPCCIVRVISDKADLAAAPDFLRFLQEVAPAYVLGIVGRMLPLLP